MNAQRFVNIWWKGLISPSYGYDYISALSLSTLKIERHDPGGLVFWEDVVELAANGICLFGLIWVASALDPIFAVLFVCLTALALPVWGSVLRFKLFKRRPATVVTTYVPACIPPELVERFDKANADLRQAMTELEDIAAANGVPQNEALRRMNCA